MSDAFHSLQENTHWPDTKDVQAWDYTLGGRGRELVDNVIYEVNAGLLLEIGCFLCASTRRWLTKHPKLKVIGVDPWDDDLIRQVGRYIGRPNLTRKYPERATQMKMLADITNNKPFPTAMANVVEFRDRFIPFRGWSPDALRAIKDAGIEPDVIYIDCDKKPDELEVSHELWPNARITGDDWHWSRTKGYPMRQVVYAFAEKHGFSVEAEGATWVLHP
ncbi:MAG: hypothetical protein JJ850_01025 [Kordiimonadaceae bacterium]|nr:hypothetical protein [Kordiimonadaceae bacterium]MBO6567617.1 hypothetical protein [Kordiimonadaceae bacterium]MBO6963169.1 hypothetical protein [Kordiimonadaceae bacterium]